MLGICELTASRDLKALVDHKLLTPHGERRGRFYKAAPLVRQIGKAAWEAPTNVDGSGECRPVTLTRSFEAAKVQAYDAYLEAFVVIRSTDEDAQPVFIRVELFDEAAAKIGQREYYGGGLIPRSLRNSGKATELPIAAGVVRIPLHHVTYRYVTFSRMTVSLVHQGCGGTSELTVGSMVFCANAKSCGLTISEAPADGAAEVKRLLGTLDDNPIGSYLRGIVPAPRIAPARPSPPPAPKPMVQRVSWTPAQLAGQCDATVQAYILDARRINAVIGERPDLQGRVTDVATAMLGALKLPEGSGTAIAKNITERVVENYGMLTALGEQVGNEEYEQASATIATLVLKNLLTQVEGPAHFGKLSKTGHSWLQAYLRSIPDPQRDMVIDNLRIVLKDQPKYVEALTTGMALDLGTVAGGLSEGQVRDAMQVLVVNAATALSPQFALVKSSLLAMNEAAVAAQTYVADGEVSAMYAAGRGRRGSTRRRCRGRGKHTERAITSAWAPRSTNRSGRRAERWAAPGTASGTVATRPSSASRNTRPCTCR